mmetsp:Transcript_50254/g.92852  ORF Transcript_50254/g.92852 Transcript_50254/m.92852 type:complete len:579 (-) Transcript_50254:84-1820(-)
MPQRPEVEPGESKQDVATEGEERAASRPLAETRGKLKSDLAMLESVVQKALSQAKQHKSCIEEVFELEGAVDSKAKPAEEGEVHSGQEALPPKSDSVNCDALHKRVHQSQQFQAKFEGQLQRMEHTLDLLGKAVDATAAGSKQGREDEFERRLTEVEVTLSRLQAVWLPRGEVDKEGRNTQVSDEGSSAGAPSAAGASRCIVENQVLADAGAPLRLYRDGAPLPLDVSEIAALCKDHATDLTSASLPSRVEALEQKFREVQSPPAESTQASVVDLQAQLSVLQDWLVNIGEQVAVLHRIVANLECGRAFNVDKLAPEKATAKETYPAQPQSCCQTASTIAATPAAAEGADSTCHRVGDETAALAMEEQVRLIRQQLLAWREEEDARNQCSSLFSLRSHGPDAAVTQEMDGQRFAQEVEQAARAVSRRACIDAHRAEAVAAVDARVSAVCERLTDVHSRVSSLEQGMDTMARISMALRCQIDKLQSSVEVSLTAAAADIAELSSRQQQRGMPSHNVQELWNSMNRAEAKSAAWAGDIFDPRWPSAALSWQASATGSANADPCPSRGAGLHRERLVRPGC